MLFQYGNAVTGKYFYDRTKTQKEIQKFLNGGQSFMIKAPRRYGKTSLILNVLEKNDYEYFYVDFRKTPRLELFNNKLIEYIYSRLGIKGAIAQLKENAVSFLMKNKTNISINLPLFEASVELFSNVVVHQEERMVEALDMAEKIAVELGEKFYIVMDEFQDVVKLGTSYADILEMMRGSMQHHKNVCYVFAGSRMTLMTKIFESKKSPFFNFCRKFKLEAFDNAELLPELLQAFKTKGIVFESDKMLLELLELLKGHPANTMLVMQILEGIMEDSEIKLVNTKIINEAYNKAYEELQDLIGEYIRDIRSKDHLHDVIYRIANNEEQILEPSSLRQKKGYLVDMGYLSREGHGDYAIIDGFLEEDLKR